MKNMTAPSSQLTAVVSASSAEASSADTGPAAAKSSEAIIGVRLEGDALSRGLVEVRHTGTAKGHGVFAIAPLPTNTWVGDYVGEVLNQAQYLARYPQEDGEYVLGANEDYNIDAIDPQRSSFVRYLNHSAAEPAGHANVFFEVAKVRRQREKQVKFFTARRLEAGEELLFDYGAQYWAGRKAQQLS